MCADAVVSAYALHVPCRLASSAANANSDIVSPYGLTTIAAPTAQPIAVVAPGQVLLTVHHTLLNNKATLLKHIVLVGCC